MSVPMSRPATHTTSLAAEQSQLGILASIPPLGRYLTFSLVDESQARNALGLVREGIDGESAVLGFGESLVESLDANIPGLKPFPAMVGAGIEVPATPGSLWCWLRGSDRGELIHHSRQLQ